MLGYYENFPSSTHLVETFNSAISSRRLQQKLIKIFCEINKREFSFEDVAIPTFPDGKVLFEFGLADTAGFSFIDEEEAAEAVRLLAKEQLQLVDFFCAIRYYKGNQEKKVPLKFDYYFVRTTFGKGFFEIRVFHERGPRYLSPQDLIIFIFNKLNEHSNRQVLKRTPDSPEH